MIKNKFATMRALPGMSNKKKKLIDKLESIDNSITVFKIKHSGSKETELSKDTLKELQIQRENICKQIENCVHKG